MICNNQISKNTRKYKYHLIDFIDSVSLSITPPFRERLEKA
jgi:hypothetical protein